MLPRSAVAAGQQTCFSLFLVFLEARLHSTANLNIFGYFILYSYMTMYKYILQIFSHGWYINIQIMISYIHGS